MRNKHKIKAVVFGLFETGLGVIRSLGQKGIKVIGVDFKKDIGCYSRYVTPLKCPHPLLNEAEFLDWIALEFSSKTEKYPVFFTSDDFLFAFSKNREQLSKYFFFNLPNHSILERISNKFSQFQLAKNAGIEVPETFVVNNVIELIEFSKINITFPLFIKGLDVNLWRNKISDSVKGYLVNDVSEFIERTLKIIEKEVPVIIQEVIEGPDTNHFKYCSYVSSSGNILGEFTLRKIRQNPIHFGVGAVVESIEKPDLIGIGRKLFSSIGFNGIGSAEFKYDNKDGKLKLIEINPRYWQQNYLSTFCGVNFPYLNYLDLLLESPKKIIIFEADVKWVNLYMDFDSFINYRKEGVLTFSSWRNSLKGKKCYHDFILSDPLPVLYEISFGLKFIKLPFYLCKKLFK